MKLERASEEEQAEKKRMKIRPCVPEISHIKVKVYTIITGKLDLKNGQKIFGISGTYLPEKTKSSTAFRFGTVVHWTNVHKNNATIFDICLCF